MDIEKIKKALPSENPEYTIVKISDFEDETHKSYKDLFEANLERYKEITKKIAELEKTIKEKTKEIEGLSKRNKELELRKSNIDPDDLKELSNLSRIISLPKEMLHDAKASDLDGDEITTLSDEKKIEKKDLSPEPAIYNFKKPSAVALKCLKEYKESSVRNRTVKNTKGSLLNLLKFRREIAEKSEEQAAILYDVNRRDEIIKICNDKNCTNNEKYIRYMLLCPGIDKNFEAILDKAAELGINANVVIALLEQPQSQYNKNLITNYVTSVFKGNEYNLKKELARELINGNWYITAKTENGELIKYSLVPFNEIEQLSRELNRVIKMLSGDKESQPIKKPVDGIVPE